MVLEALPPPVLGALCSPRVVTRNVLLDGILTFVYRVEAFLSGFFLAVCCTTCRIARSIPLSFSRKESQPTAHFFGRVVPDCAGQVG